jgi:hypothetical protein
MKHGNLVFYRTESFEHAFLIDLLKRLTSHILPTAFKYFFKTLWTPDIFIAL